ncbi:MAG: response regulator [Bdellovibrionaceae bacterium]|nr:response regulator [Pseudobdellovibrionaceae bacterium]|tara:strand:- start:20397 stop:20897 length:501 start_codon:yes stop_codon:yes gene_type:complete
MSDQVNENKLSQLNQYLSFELRNQIYAVPIENVIEINQVAEITPVPEAPHYINGVLNLRGKIIPIVDLGCKFGFSDAEFTNRSCIIVLETVNGMMGTIVDSVRDVIDIATDSIEDSSNFSSEIAKEYVAGLAKLEDMVCILLNLAKVLDKGELSVGGSQQTAEQAS